MGLDFGLTADGIVTVISILGGGFVFLFRMEGKLNILMVERKAELQMTTNKFIEIAKQFEAVERQLEKLTEIFTQQARIEQKVSTLEDRIIALSNAACSSCKSYVQKRKSPAKA